MTCFNLTGRQAVYSCLRFGSGLLRDEAYRYRYIDSILAVRDLHGFEVYAYALFGDRVYMLAGKFGEYTLMDACEDVKTVLTHFLENGSVQPPDLAGFLSGDGPSYSLCHLCSRKEILDTTIYIHLVARNLKAAVYGFDYWWTSAKAYHTGISWNGIDSNVVLEMVSPDREHARRIFIRRHREQERARNPMPGCLKDPFVVRSPSDLAQWAVTNTVNDGIKRA